VQNFSANFSVKSASVGDLADARYFLEQGQSSSAKSYPGDNRLVASKSPYRRSGSAPRCRLGLSWGWRRSQGFGCSPIKKSRELGSDRRETGRSPIFCGRRNL